MKFVKVIKHCVDITREKWQRTDGTNNKERFLICILFYFLLRKRMNSRLNENFTNPWSSLQSDMTLLLDASGNKLMHLYLHICSYLGLNYKVIVACNAVKNAYVCIYLIALPLTMYLYM